MKYCIHADCIIFRYDVAMFLFCHISYKYYATLSLIYLLQSSKIFIESALRKAHLAT